jgi:hemerythrin
MAYMPWNETYSVGVESIDDEHRELMGLLDELKEGLEASASEVDIKKIFRRLIICASTHFWHEEKYFEETDYPRAAVHRRKHEHLMVILTCFQKGFDQSGLHISFEDQIAFLRDWLIDHIACEDRPLGDYLNAQGHSKSVRGATL